MLRSVRVTRGLPLKSVLSKYAAVRPALAPVRNAVSGTGTGTPAAMGEPCAYATCPVPKRARRPSSGVTGARGVAW
jgi:hypothetical protein